MTKTAQKNQTSDPTCTLTQIEDWITDNRMTIISHSESSDKSGGTQEETYSVVIKPKLDKFIVQVIRQITDRLWKAKNEHPKASTIYNNPIGKNNTLYDMVSKITIATHLLITGIPNQREWQQHQQCALVIDILERLGWLILHEKHTKQKIITNALSNRINFNTDINSTITTRQ